MSDEIQSTASANEGTAIPGEVSPLMQEALDQGWVPKEDYSGDPERWVDHGEFVRRGELFRKIESQSKELKDVKKALSELAKHNQKIAQIEYDRALKELRSQKKEALAEGDAERVVDVEEKIDLIKDQQKAHQAQALEQAKEQVLAPEFVNWTAKNQWYETDKRMRAFADTLGVQLAQEGLSPTEVLKEVEKEARARYPEKFSNPNRAKPGAVEGNTSRANVGRGDDTEAGMSAQEKQIMHTIINTGVLTKAEYLKQYKATKGN